MSTEYIVILAVVLVIALVVVYLAGGYSGLGAGSIEQQGRAYWKSASPFAITDYNASGTELGFTLQNKDAEALTITGISVGGDPVFSGESVLDGGEAKAFSVGLASSCGEPGTAFILENVVITYDRGPISGLRQAGAKPLMGKCQ